MSIGLHAPLQAQGCALVIELGMAASHEMIFRAMIRCQIIEAHLQLIMPELASAFYFRSMPYL